MLKVALHFFKTTPSFLYLCTVLLSTLPALLFNDFSIVLFIILPLLFSLILWLYFGKYVAGISLCFATISISLLYYHSLQDITHYEQIVKVLPKTLEINCTITDTLLPPIEADSFLKAPFIINADIHQLRINNDTEYQIVTGSMVLKFSTTLEKTDQYKQLHYGDQVNLIGHFEYPATPLDSTQFNMRYYLYIRQTPMIFYVDTILNIAPDHNSWTKYILNARDDLLLRSTNNLSPRNQQYISALCFGFKQALSSNIKQDYIKTGIIHIFTVSGFHIGLLAIILLFLFRPLPIFSRYFSIFLLTGAYTLSTGFQISSLRAWLMICIFLLLQAFLRKTNNLNTLFLIACIFLAYRIEWIFDAGFLYSFSATIFLIVSWTPITTTLRWFHAHNNWIPYRKRSPLKNKINIILEAPYKSIASSFFALLGTLPISCYFLGYFAPISILLNLLFLPIIFLIFVFVLAKMTLSISLADPIINLMFESIHMVNLYFANHVDQHIIYLSLSGFFALVIWVLLLLCIGLPFKHKAYILSTTAFIIALLLCFNAKKKETELFIVYGENLPPALLFHDSMQSLNIMVNTIDIRVVNYAKNYFFSKKSKNLNYLVITDTTYQTSRACNYLSSGLHISKIILPNFTDTPYAIQHVLKATSNIHYLKYNLFENAHLSFYSTPKQFDLSIYLPDRPPLVIHYNAHLSTLTINDKKHVMTQSSSLRIKKIEF